MFDYTTIPVIYRHLKTTFSVVESVPGCLKTAQIF